VQQLVHARVELERLVPVLLVEAVEVHVLEGVVGLIYVSFCAEYVRPRLGGGGGTLLGCFGGAVDLTMGGLGVLMGGLGALGGGTVDLTVVVLA
jgi:hypothetical protein